MAFQHDMTFDFYYLLQDGLLKQIGFERTGFAGNWVAGIWHYALTDEGRDFLDHLQTGHHME